MIRRLAKVLTTIALIGTGSHASGSPIFWTDWQTSNGGIPFVASGEIVTTTSTVGVTYTNPQGINFFQTGTGTDYFTSGGVRDPATSPYTSNAVDNIPTASEMISLKNAGNQTLQFSEQIANPVFSYVSLNGNGYAFDQDFEILSFGNSSDGNSCGYWGCGTSFKVVVSLGSGNFEYQLLGGGEPHGTLRFLGAFSSVTWRSLSSENWNGFTVGVQGTAAEVFSVSEPHTVVLLAMALLGLVPRARRVSRARST